MLDDVRLKKIVELLQQKKVMKTSDLLKELYCSPSTLRRDLIKLENDGLIIRGHGKVRLKVSINTEFSYFYRDVAHSEEKEYIANLAQVFLADGQALFLDSSSTVERICPYLEKYNNTIVVTNGLNIAQKLADYDNVKVHIAGGILKSHSSSIIGELAGTFLSNFNADIAFISCRGLDLDGIYEADLNQALYKQKMMKNAKSTILLCDDSKFNTAHYFRLATYGTIDAIITNSKPTVEYFNIAESNDCEILW